MKIQVREGERKHEIELLPLTQLCGMDTVKKQYIVNSLRKHFSAERYMEHEKKMIQNVSLEGEDTIGRKYFKVVYLKEREDYIGGIKLGKNSLMMQYLSDRIEDFQYQKYIEEIGGQLQKIFLSLNHDLLNKIGDLAFSYEEKDIFSMVQSANIGTFEEEPLEWTDNWKLVKMYLNILLEIHKKKPEKILIIMENIDHLLHTEEYVQLCAWIEENGKKYDIWFLLSTSISGYVYFSQESIQGINIINDVIFYMPDYDKMYEFLYNNYPCTFSAENWREELKAIVHFIGKENLHLFPKGMVMLKMINKSMCVETIGRTGLNQMENSFLLK